MNKATLLTSIISGMCPEVSGPRPLKMNLKKSTCFNCGKELQEGQYIYCSDKCKQEKRKELKKNDSI